MSQTDQFHIPNLSGAAFRALLNQILAALSDQNTGSTEPPEPFPGMVWLDTSTNPARYKLRNDANSGWHEIFTTQQPPTAAQIGLGNVPNYNATNSLTDNSDNKLLLASAAYRLNELKLGKGDAAADASKLGGYAANMYALVSGIYPNLRAQGTTKADVDLGNVQNFGITSSLTSNNANQYLSAKGGYDLNQMKVDKTITINGHKLDKSITLSALHIRALPNTGGDIGGPINFTADTGDIIKLDGKTLLKRTTANGGVSFGADDSMIIGAGEARAAMEANINQPQETLWLGSDNDLVLFSNLEAGWASRRTFTLEKDGGFMPANVAKTRENLDVPTRGEVDGRGRIVGELCYFSMDTVPAGFFALNGARVVNGRLDFPALASCGSRFITLSGNDLILANAQDFLRGKGASGRAVGQWEGDAIRNITGHLGTIGLHAVPSGAFAAVGSVGSQLGPHPGPRPTIDFDASRVVPVAGENRPKSLTALLCIYHGVV